MKALSPGGIDYQPGFLHLYQVCRLYKPHNMSIYGRRCRRAAAISPHYAHLELDARLSTGTYYQPQLFSSFGLDTFRIHKPFCYLSRPWLQISLVSFQLSNPSHLVGAKSGNPQMITKPFGYAEGVYCKKASAHLEPWGNGQVTPVIFRAASYI
jgi:hypothetical protein